MKSKEENVGLVGWSLDYDPCEIYVKDKDIFLGFFETYEEAVQEGNRLVKEGKISDFDTYVN